MYFRAAKKGRSYKTKYLLREALATLISQKGSHEITVKELTRLAGINRGTFYSHYRNIEELIDQVENELLGEFEELAHSYTPEEIDGNTLQVITDMFRFFADNSQICIALSGNQLNSAFFLRLKNIVRDTCFYDWDFDLSKKRGIENTHYYEFLAYGCVGAFESWVSHGMKETPEEMAVLICKILMTGIQTLT